MAGRWPKRKECGEERIAVWLLVLAVELVHGTLRWIFLRPHVGDFRSGQIGVFTGSVLFLLIVYFCERWMTFAKLRGWLARWTALGSADAGLRMAFWARPDGALVGRRRGGVQPIARGTDAGWAGHFCGDARDGVAITRGVSESLKEGWLGARVAVRFCWLAGRGRKSGVKPAHSK